MIFLTYPLATGKGAKPTLQHLDYMISPPFSAVTTIKPIAFQATFWTMSFLLSPFFLFFCWPLISQRFEGEKIQRFGVLVASPAGFFRGARICSLKTPAGEAIYSGTYWIGYGVSESWFSAEIVLSMNMQWNLDITNLYITKYSVWWTFFFTQRIVKYMEKNLDIRKPR